MNKYIGNDMQIYSVREARLMGGKADGMRILTVKNGKGLEFTVSLDRCADIAELSLKGDNFAYISPCGYVAPTFYEREGIGFLKSFTAGFITTCGLANVGNPCVDEGVEYNLHGTVSHIPCEQYSYYVENDEIHIKATVRDASLFSYKLLLEREYVCSLSENKIVLIDKIKNIGFDSAPLQVLYHCNMGYPLLSEKATLNIPSNEVAPRNEHSKEGISICKTVEEPQRNYEEMCFYHSFETDTPTVSLYNDQIKKGVEMTYSTKQLPFFTQWKMMGEGEYVMGLEPGNCNPDGRDVMRKNGTLEMLEAGTEKEHRIEFKFIG